MNRTYEKLFQQGALPQAVRLYGKAAQRRWNGGPLERFCVSPNGLTLDRTGSQTTHKIAPGHQIHEQGRQGCDNRRRHIDVVFLDPG